MSQSSQHDKRREFWITFKPYVEDPLGPCTNVLKYVATFAHEHGVRVREVLPGEITIRRDQLYRALSAEAFVIEGSEQFDALWNVLSEGQEVGE